MEFKYSGKLSLLELLHIEVTTVIAGYLSVKDLGACCATSSTMRDNFNDNGIWKERCDINLAEYLEITPCKVEPRFEIPQVNDCSLNPLPKWRVSFMRENHLQNNWRQGIFKKEEIKSQNPRSHSHYYHFLRFLNNDCIIAHSRDWLELLDIKEFPADEANEKISFFSHKISHLMQVDVNDNNMIVVLLGSFVQVFHVDFTEKNCKLNHVFFFDELEKRQFDDINEIEKLFPMSKVPIPPYTHRHVLVGSFFVGILDGQSTMHVWNLKTGQKLKEALCPLERGVFCKITHSNNMNLLLTFHEIGKELCTIFAYDLNKLEYHPFNMAVNADAECSIYRDFVVIFSENIIQFFNYKSLTPIITSIPASSPPTIINDNFLYVMDGKINKCNLSTKKIAILSPDGVISFQRLSNKFVLVRKFSWMENRNGRLELWEIDRACNSMKKTSMNLWSPMDLWFLFCGIFLNKACTRYIVKKGFENVLHFW